MLFRSGHLVDLHIFGICRERKRNDFFVSPLLFHLGKINRPFVNSCRCTGLEAEQGVLLLNATLTVRAHQAGSHQNRGWETFTDAAIRILAEEREHLVFILWGAYAQRKGAFIDRNKHLVLTSAHPSPLSAYNGFFGNKHFSKTNEYLKAHGKEEIKW